MVLAVTPPDLPQGPATKLFLGGLPAGVTDEDLREHFETFGKVDESVVKQPQGMSMQSHFGFLWVRPAEAARQIIAQGHTIHCASGLSVTIPAPVLARSTRMSKTWHSLRPAGPPEAPPSVRWFRLPQNFGQPRPISRSGRAGWHRRPCFRLL
jgi:RNA recognition motif-containing protein